MERVSNLIFQIPNNKKGARSKEEKRDFCVQDVRGFCQQVDDDAYLRPEYLLKEVVGRPKPLMFGPAFKLVVRRPPRSKYDCLSPFPFSLLIFVFGSPMNRLVSFSLCASYSKFIKDRIRSCDVTILSRFGAWAPNGTGSCAGSRRSNMLQTLTWTCVTLHSCADLHLL